MFFLGYAVSQIPATSSPNAVPGGWYRSPVGFSAFTWLMGTVSSVFGLKLVRLGLGLSEGPCPVGLASTINNWFPPKEKATATGVYIAATMFAPIIVLPLAVWIAVTWGWRWVFFCLLYPELWRPSRGICWSNPSLLESGFVSQSELAEINAGRESHNNSVRENILIAERFTWLDKIIRVKKMAPIDTAKGLFTSKNILGDCLAYFMMVSVLYGLLTWMPCI